PARLSSSYSSSRARGAVHSFPTRRSSDLPPPAGSGGGFGARARGADGPPPHSGCDRHLAGAERAAGGGGACLPQPAGGAGQPGRSEEHTSELQSRENLVCRRLLEKKNAVR